MAERNIFECRNVQMLFEDQRKKPIEKERFLPTGKRRRSF